MKKISILFASTLIALSSSMAFADTNEQKVISSPSHGVKKSALYHIDIVNINADTPDTPLIGEQQIIDLSSNDIEKTILDKNHNTFIQHYNLFDDGYHPAKLVSLNTYPIMTTPSLVHDVTTGLYMNAETFNNSQHIELNYSYHKIAPYTYTDIKNKNITYNNIVVFKTQFDSVLNLKSHQTLVIPCLEQFSDDYKIIKKVIFISVDNITD